MSKKIILKSSDGESFEVDEAVALQSETLAHLIEDDCVENGVPLANVSSKILVKIIEYCKEHVDESEEKKEELKKFDAKFMEMDKSTLFELMLAANYLNIKNLLDICCQDVADMVPGKTVEQLREFFNVESEYTEEEEEEMRRDYQWAYEGTGSANP